MKPRFPQFSDRQRYRFFEMVPGLLVWGTFAFTIFATLTWPTKAIVFALVLDIYWFVRICYLMIFVLAAYRRYRRTLAIDWRARVEAHPKGSQLWHVIFVPTVNESETVLRETFQALVVASYAPERTLVVLATEARSSLQSTGVYQRLKDEFSHTFAGLIVTIHPAGRPGEVAGKGANIAWAGHQVKTWIDEHGLRYPDVIVTTIDADSIIHPDYLAYLACVYADHPRPTRTSYQPIPLFHNNIWEALPWMRVVAYSTTFWLMGDTQRPDRLFTFSSHSMPFQALVDVDFWQTDVVSEDSRIFLQCLIRYDGDYEVTPLYLPVSMDAIHAPTWLESMKNQYKQIRRWAYGAENFPFMVWNFLADRAMPLGKKLRYIYYQLEGMYSWAVAPILIMLLGWLPFQVDPSRLEGSFIAQNAPLALRWIMIAAMVGAIVSAILTLLMLPKRPVQSRISGWVTMILQWLFLPVTMLIFGSIPAIESQSRLLLGRYLGFWVTDKHRQAEKA